MKQKRKVLVVDDHPVVRQGLAQFINDEEDFIVCGEAEDASAALLLCERLRPDIVIADITLGKENGLELTADIRKKFGFPVLVLSMHEEDFYAERALRAGAAGYIMKRESMASVVSAMREILAGKIYLGHAVKDRLLDTALASSAPRDPLGALTNREIDIMKRIGEGMKNMEIARELGISVKTVETYRARIIEKLNFSGSAELARFSVNWRQNEGKNL
jgi:DNA-binding NarL/FixJ family response regulator